MIFNVDFADLLVPWSFFGGKDDSKCILGVLKAKPSSSSISSKEIFLGAAFMDKYYTVFDNTAYTTNPNDNP